MTVQEIFNTTAVRSIEEQILTLYDEYDRKGLQEDGTKKAIISLLKVRKNVLDSMFVLEDSYKALLKDFNDALKDQLIEMRNRTIAVYQTVIKDDTPGNLEVESKCLLGYEYSKIHPIQTIRAKKIWAILNGSLDDFMPLYEYDGAGTFNIREWNDVNSELQMLYLDEKLDNWNEGLDRDMTSDMHLIHAFHNLFCHMEFSIFDLLWVRDFNIEIHTDIDYHTYKSDDYGDDLDWNKCDYLD